MKTKTRTVDVGKALAEQKKAVEVSRHEAQSRRTTRRVSSRPMEGATPRQTEVLDWMRTFYKEHGGVPPTIRQIMAGIGTSSPNGVMCHLKALHSKGLVTSYSKGSSRGWIPVTENGVCPLCGQKMEVAT